MATSYSVEEYRRSTLNIRTCLTLALRADVEMLFRHQISRRVRSVMATHTLAQWRPRFVPSPEYCHENLRPKADYKAIPVQINTATLFRFLHEEYFTAPQYITRFNHVESCWGREVLTHK